jgi:hypothetical protein
MTEPIFLTDEGFERIKTLQRLRKVLQRDGKGYLRNLHARCGVGLTVSQFDELVNKLAESRWCSLKEGAYGATLVVFNEQVRNSAEPVAQ